MSATSSFTLRLTPEDRAELDALALAEGVTASVFVYRRAFGRPDAHRKAGRPPKHARTQDEQLFDKTG